MDTGLKDLAGSGAPLVGYVRCSHSVGWGDEIRDPGEGYAGARLIGR